MSFAMTFFFVAGGSHRAFHQLSKEERASFEKKRLSEYCRWEIVHLDIYKLVLE